MEFRFYFSVAYFHSLYLAWLIVFCWCQKGINLPVVFRLIMIDLSHTSLAVHGIVVFLRCSGRASKNEISETKICVKISDSACELTSKCRGCTWPIMGKLFAE